MCTYSHATYLGNKIESYNLTCIVYRFYDCQCGMEMTWCHIFSLGETWFFVCMCLSCSCIYCEMTLHVVVLIPMLRHLYQKTVFLLISSQFGYLAKIRCLFCTTNDLFQYSSSSKRSSNRSYCFFIYCGYFFTSLSLCTHAQELLYIMNCIFL